MAARVDELSMLEPVHEYYADADLLSADIEQPIKEVIKPRAYVELPKDGRYQFKHAEPFHLEGILSYQSGYTQVAGHPSSKTAGFSTLATSVIEGLNVLDVVTADRVVAQISTVHPAYGNGQVPSVTFLGTRFDNLRIAGQKVETEQCLEILGPRNEDDRSYFDDREVMNRISQQYERIAECRNLPDWAREEYLTARPALMDHAEFKCSVIDRVEGSPGTSFGHVIDLPHFGKIFLGELKVRREPGNPARGTYDKYKFHLTMIRLQMGCLAQGTTCIGTLDSNGGGSQGSGGIHH